MNEVLEPPRISVVAPLFGSAATVGELVERIARALEGEHYEIVLVDDASPDASLEEARACLSRPEVRLLAHRVNGGQHRAVLSGFAAARGHYLVSLDADLQDPPESISALVDFAEREGLDAVFAGRIGTYQSAGRHVFSRLFKDSLAVVAGVPRRAGMFFVLDGRRLDDLLAWDAPRPFVVAMLGLARLRCGVLPVERERSRPGSSSYSAYDRWRVGWRAIRFTLRSRWRGPHPVQDYGPPRSEVFLD